MYVWEKEGKKKKWNAVKITEVEEEQIRRNQSTTQEGKNRPKQNPESTLAIIVEHAATNTAVSALARGEVLLTQCTTLLSISSA